MLIRQISLIFYIILFVSPNFLCCIESNEKPSVIICDPTGKHPVGMFCHIGVILGLLDRFDKGEFGGIHVDYAETSNYYDFNYGFNWFEYFWEPIKTPLFDDQFAINTRYDSALYFDGFVKMFVNEFKQNRQRLNELVNKYLIVKKPIQNEVDEFVNDNFNEHFVIGIHYRGTDKITWKEAERVSYSQIVQKIFLLVQENKLEDYRIFIATDEQAFLDYIKLFFPNKVLSQQALRSTDDTPLHYGRKYSPYQLGKEALIDALLLSRCSFLMRTCSNLSIFSACCNADLPELVLSEYTPQ